MIPYRGEVLVCSKSFSNNLHEKPVNYKHLNCKLMMAASDEIVWQVIDKQFCSFKLKYVCFASYWHTSELPTNTYFQTQYENANLLSQRTQRDWLLQPTSLSLSQFTLCNCSSRPFYRGTLSLPQDTGTQPPSVSVVGANPSALKL